MQGELNFHWGPAVPCGRAAGPLATAYGPETPWPKASSHASRDTFGKGCADKPTILAHSDGSPDAPQISMLWNWYTTDGAPRVDAFASIASLTDFIDFYADRDTACFLTEGWKIRNTGDYVGTLIGVSPVDVVSCSDKR